MLGGILQYFFIPLVLDMNPSSCAKSLSKSFPHALKGKSCCWRVPSPLSLNIIMMKEAKLMERREFSLALSKLR